MVRLALGILVVLLLMQTFMRSMLMGLVVLAILALLLGNYPVIQQQLGALWSPLKGNV